MIITKIHKTHVACPATWDALTKGGEQIRFHYRWGTLHIEMPPGEIPLPNIQYGDEDWGSLSFDELINLVDTPETEIEFDCEES